MLNTCTFVVAVSIVCKSLNTSYLFAAINLYLCCGHGSTGPAVFHATVTGFKVLQLTVFFDCIAKCDQVCLLLADPWS